MLWSLTNLEAIDLLNSYGFNCKYENYLSLSSSCIEILRSLSDLKFVKIVREVKPGEVLVQHVDGTFCNLKDLIVDKFSYNDWKPLTIGIRYDIDKLSTINEKGECTC